MLMSLLLLYDVGSANRKWRPNKSRYSGLDLKRHLNNIKQKLEELTEMNNALFLVKEAGEKSTPDEKTQGKLTNALVSLPWVAMNKS